MITHWFVYDAMTRDGGRQQVTLCNEWGNPHTDHAAEPACPKCSRLIADDDAAIAALEAMPAGPEPLDVYRTAEAEREHHESLSQDGDWHARTSLGARAVFVQPIGMHAPQSEAGSEPADSHTTSIEQFESPSHEAAARRAGVIK